MAPAHSLFGPTLSRATKEPIPGVTGKLVVDGVQLSAPGRRTVYLPHRRDVVTQFDRLDLDDGRDVPIGGRFSPWLRAHARALVERIKARRARRP